LERGWRLEERLRQVEKAEVEAEVEGRGLKRG
jgi:hypothetical protein